MLNPYERETRERTDGRRWLPRAVGLLGGLALGLLLLEGMTRTARIIDFGTAQRIDSLPRTVRPVDALFQSSPPIQRILILGDSMAYAPGIGSSALWSTRLEEMLNAAGPSVEVVNLARGGDNTYGQLQVLRQALSQQPIDLVLLLYNHNDVYGSRQPLTSESGRSSGHGTVGAGGTREANKSSEVTATSDQPSGSRAIGGPVQHLDRRSSPVARTARWLRQRSEYSGLALTRVGMQLRAWGILVPGTEFHHLARRAYGEHSAGWTAVQQELTAMQQLADSSSAEFAVYVLPQFASLRHDFFADIRSQLASHAEENGTTIGFGFPQFEGASWRTFAISPFDGHPNERANQRIAGVIYDWIEERQLLGATADR